MHIGKIELINDGDADGRRRRRAPFRSQLPAQARIRFKTYILMRSGGMADPRPCIRWPPPTARCMARLIDASMAPAHHDASNWWTLRMARVLPLTYLHDEDQFLSALAIRSHSICFLTRSRKFLSVCRCGWPRTRRRERGRRDERGGGRSRRRRRRRTTTTRCFRPHAEECMSRPREPSQWQSFACSRTARGAPSRSRERWGGMGVGGGGGVNPSPKGKKGLGEKPRRPLLLDLLRPTPRGLVGLVTCSSLPPPHSSSSFPAAVFFLAGWDEWGVCSVFLCKRVFSEEFLVSGSLERERREIHYHIHYSLRIPRERCLFRRQSKLMAFVWRRRFDGPPGRGYQGHGIHYHAPG